MQPRQEEMNNRLVDILSESVRRYISFISSSHKIGDGYKSRKGIEHYGFIPTNTILILETLFRLYCHMESCPGEHKFLDIGCGIGNIVLLAYEIGFNAYGLEYNKKIYDIAKDLVNEDRIFKGDMTNFKKYGEYDVLYYYAPIYDRKIMNEFVEKLVKAVKPGAYVIPHEQDPAFRIPKKFETVKFTPRCSIDYPIYRKR